MSETKHIPLLVPFWAVQVSRCIVRDLLGHEGVANVSGVAKLIAEAHKHSNPICKKINSKAWELVILIGKAQFYREIHWVNIFNKSRELESELRLLTQKEIGR